MKNIIIRADDYGISPGVNRGILETLSYGLVKNAGVMINLEDACDVLKFIDPEKTDIGLHGNISVGKPLCNSNEVSSLIDENGLCRSKNLLH